jgi:pimeloyl-ACP methyl ester carboxylesterase
LLALEARAGLELAGLFAALPFLRLAPRGDGHPVLVLPGWLADDTSTRALRWFLRRLGYHAHGWRLGRNMGAGAEVIARLEDRLADLRARHRRKLSLIGWSLGGVYARELAHRFPADVRQVITLGSPFREMRATSVARLYGARRGNGATTDETESRDRDELRRRLRMAPPVPCTSFYSRTDGIVAWRSCLDDDGPLRENVEVQSSHCGMGHNPAVLWLVAERLAHPEGAWQPLAARSSFWPLRALGVALRGARRSAP